MLSTDDSIANYSLSTLDGAPPASNIYIWRFEQVMQEKPYLERPHRHPHFEVFILRGKGQYFNDFKTYSFHGSNLVFVSPGQVHWWKKYETLKGFCLLFDKTFYDEGLPADTTSLLKMPFWFSPDQSSIIPLPETYQEGLLLLGEKIHHEFQENKTWNEDIIRLLLKILLRVAQRIHNDHFPNSNTLGASVYRDFLIEIEKQLPAFRNVDEYARSLQISVSELAKHVRAVAGTTPAVLLRERKLLEAKRLLIHANLTFQQIAYQLQFSDPSYFTKFFQKQTGMTPSLFRQKHQK